MNENQTTDDILLDDNNLKNAVVELTAPDGRVYLFRYGASLPYAGETYTVLILHNTDDPASSDENGEQILITKVEKSQTGDLLFNTVEEDDIIDAVYNKYIALKIRNNVSGLSDAE